MESLGEVELIHNAGNTYNKNMLYPVIIGYFTEDDEGNLEYTYYERYDVRGIG